MSDRLSMPHDAQAKREIAIAETLVKQGERLAAQIAHLEAKLDEQRNLAERGWEDSAKWREAHDNLSRARRMDIDAVERERDQLRNEVARLQNHAVGQMVAGDLQDADVRKATFEATREHAAKYIEGYAAAVRRAGHTDTANTLISVVHSVREFRIYQLDDIERK